MIKRNAKYLRFMKNFILTKTALFLMTFFFFSFVDYSNTILNSKTTDTIQPSHVFPKIRLGFNSSDNYHRQILMGFMNDLATSAIDPGYDALLFDNFPSDMYFMNGDTRLVIQGEGYFNPSTAYRLGVKTGEEGTVQFMLDELVDFEPGQQIFIYDAVTQTCHEITNGTFEINLPAGQFEDRFSLHFTNSTLGIINNIDPKNNLTIAFTANDNTLNIANTSIDLIVKSVAVLNMLGQNLQNLSITNGNQQLIQVPVTNLSAGTYIIQLDTSAGKISKKIAIR